MKKILKWLSLFLVAGWLQPLAAQTLPPDIIAAEYFFDTDPGIGNGNALTITTPGQTVSFNTALSVSGLIPGSHTLYIRVKDGAGVWSLHESFPFRIFRQLQKAEYFIDTDPGVGNGTPIAIAQADTFLQNLNISLSGVLPGQHTLYVRSADINGVWSLQESQAFDIKSQVISGEYFFDTDPGVGLATAFAVTPADTVSQSLSISVSGVASGEHWLYTRTKNLQGNWGLPEARRIWVQPRVIAGEYFLDTDPGIGKGFPISMTAADTVNFNQGLAIPVCTSPGAHQLYVRTKDDRQLWSLYEPQQIMVNTIDPGVVTASVVNDTVKCDDGSRMRFYNITDGKILTSIQHNGQSLNGINVSTYVRPGVYTAVGLNLMNRSYVVKATQQPTGPVRMRLYFTAAELSAYQVIEPSVLSINDLNVLEYQGPTEDDIYSPYDATLTRRINPVATGTEYGAYYLEIETTGFSEFYLLNRSLILPLQLLAFDGRVMSGFNRLTWQTTREENTAFFHVERSDDGISFYNIGKVAAAGNSTAIRNYGFDDSKSFGSIVYYRLTMYDRDGKTTRSRQLALQQADGKEQLVLLPNPVSTKVFVKLPVSWQGLVQWRMINAAGIMIRQGKTTVQPGTVLNLPVEMLSPGVYQVEVQYGNKKQLLKMIKE